MEDLSIRSLGRTGAEEGCAGMKDSKMYGKVATSMWQSPSLRLFKQEHNEVTIHSPVKPSYTLCGPLLPDPVQAELPTLTVNTSQGKNTDLLLGGLKLPFNLAGIHSSPPKVSEQCCSREMGSVSISFFMYFIRAVK